MARLEDVIGYGTHAARPAAGSAGALYYETDTDTLFRDNGSTWDTLTFGSSATIDQVILDFDVTTDVTQAVSANTWTDFGSNHSFTVADASSLVTITVGGNVLGVGAGSQGSLGARIVVDSAGTPQNKLISGSYQESGSSYANVLAGARPVVLSGLSAASHTVKLQVRAEQAGNFLCRTATQPLESLSVVVREQKP